MRLDDLGEKTGLSASYLSRLENGLIRKPSDDKLKKLARALKLPYADLASASSDEADLDRILDEVASIHSSLQSTNSQLADLRRSLLHSSVRAGEPDLARDHVLDRKAVRLLDEAIRQDQFFWDTVWHQRAGPVPAPPTQANAWVSGERDHLPSIDDPVATGMRDGSSRRSRIDLSGHSPLLGTIFGLARHSLDRGRRALEADRFLEAAEWFAQGLLKPTESDAFDAAVETEARLSHHGEDDPTPRLTERQVIESRDKLRLEAHLGLVTVAFERGRLWDGVEQAEIGLTQATATHLMPERAELLVRLAEIHDARGEHVQADTKRREATDIVESSAWPSSAPRDWLRANLDRLWGNIRVRRGDWNLAEIEYAKALQITADPAADLTDHQRQELLAWVYRDRSRLFVRFGRMEDAIDAARSSFDHRVERGQGVRAVAHLCAHAADVYRSTSDDVDDRLHLVLFRALEVFESIDDHMNCARQHLRIARLYRKKLLPWDAAYWARKVLDFAVAEGTTRDDGTIEPLPLYRALGLRQLGLALEIGADQVQSIATNGTGSHAPEFRQPDSLRLEAMNCLRESVSLLNGVDRYEYLSSMRAAGAMLARSSWSLREDPSDAGDRETLIAEAREYLDEALLEFEDLGADLDVRKVKTALFQIQTQQVRANLVG